MNEKNVFLDINEVGVLHVIAKNGQGIIPFKVIDKMVRPFEYGKLGIQIAPAANSGTAKLSGTFGGTTVNDMFYFDDVEYLLQIYLECFPALRIYPSWISGYLQSDYHDILPGTIGQPYGYIWPPVNVMAIPKVTLAWVFYNQLGTETIDPFLKFNYGVYNHKLITDADVIMDILAKRYRPEPKWFTIYGRKTFQYDFKNNMKISQPIPVDATKEKVQAIVTEWAALGQWT